MRYFWDGMDCLHSGSEVMKTVVMLVLNRNYYHEP